jgi:membrane-bound serine protease (ClpP class)
MRHLPGARRMILTPPNPAIAGTAPDASEPFIGAIGRAVSDLRPSGKANFDGRLTDVVTDGEYILSGTAIVVVGKAQHQLLVKALDK